MEDFFTTLACYMIGGLIAGVIWGAIKSIVKTMWR